MTNRPSQSLQGFSPPWSARAEWQEANDAMAATLRNCSRRIDLLRDLAEQIRCRVNLLNPMLDALCSGTCPDCADNCCVRATVWYDFKDLLGFHLGTAAVPVAQLPRTPGGACVFLSMYGCTLPRIERPFPCTWYICAAQKYAMEGWPSSRKQFLENSLSAIRDERNRLEKLFLQEVVRT